MELFVIMPKIEPKPEIIAIQNQEEAMRKFAELNSEENPLWIYPVTVDVKIEL